MTDPKLTQEFIKGFDPNVGNLTHLQATLKPSGPRALVIGSKVYDGTEKDDRRLFYENGVGIDLEMGVGVDFVHDITRSPVKELGKIAQYDHIDCVSMLEHCKKPWLAVENIHQNMRQGASILLSVPFIWRIHAYPDDYFRFSVAGVRELFCEIEWDSLEYMAHGVKVRRSPAMHTEYGLFHARTEVVGFGIKK